MKLPMRLLSAGLLAMSLTMPASGDAGAQQQAISLATGGVAGVYFPLGGALAEAWSTEVPELTVTAESTGASVVNLRLIESGEAELAMVQNDIAYYAANADEMFAGNPALQNSLGMAMLYPEVIQIVTLASRDIARVEDLAGRSVAVGAPGSGTEANARQILEIHGISYDDVNEQFLPFGEAVDALRDGRIDAAFLTAGVPTAAVIELDATDDVVIVPIGQERGDEIAERWPFYSTLTIKAGTYAGIEQDVETVTVQAMLIVNAGLEADRVERMLEILHSESTLSKLCDTHVRGCDVSLETALDGMPIDLHPGADAYYSAR